MLRGCLISQPGSELVPARHGQQFNGVLVNATPASATTGFIYLSHDFPEGQFMMTAEVLHVGITRAVFTTLKHWTVTGLS